MTVWPSIAAYPSGRFLGRLYSIQWPNIYIFRLGNLLALLSIPHAIGLYKYRLLLGSWYTVTNRRVVECHNKISRVGGFPFVKFNHAAEIKSVQLDRFDDVRVEVQPGQAWFNAGDLIFTKDGVETFRLEGVSRPESFRHVCVKAQMSYCGVKDALARETAHA